MLSCFVEIGEILASSQSCCLRRVRLLSYYLFSSQAIATSLYTMSLQIVLSIVYKTRSLQAICIIYINKGIGVFLDSQISLQPAMSRLTQKYLNYIQLRITLYTLRFRIINRILYYLQFLIIIFKVRQQCCKVVYSQVDQLPSQPSQIRSAGRLKVSLTSIQHTYVATVHHHPFHYLLFDTESWIGGPVATLLLYIQSLILSSILLLYSMIASACLQ